MTWLEKVATFSIHPDAASRDDVARMATEIMELRGTIGEVLDGTLPYLAEKRLKRVMEDG